MTEKFKDQNGELMSSEDCIAKGSCHHFSRCCICGQFDMCIHQMGKRIDGKWVDLVDVKENEV